MSKESEKKELGEKKAKAKEANTTMNNDRLKLMEQIADTSEMGRPEDIEGVEKDEEIVAAEEKAKELQEEGVKEEPKGDELADEKDINGVRHYLQVVNGKEKWMTFPQIREAAQKVESADEYLRNAAEAARSAAAEAPSKDELPNLDEDQVADLYRKSALGDEDAIRALAKLQVRLSRLPSDVLPALDQRLSFRTELASLEAKSSDLLEDPYMGRLFKARLQELKQEAPNTKLSDAYTSIDRELRKAFPGFKSSKLQEKLERKRTLPQLTTAGTRQKEEAEEEGEEDPSQVIERMAKARGGVPHTHPRRQ